MNQELLRALILDRELGELTPEAALLLAAYLAEHPEWADESLQTVEILRLASATTRAFPEHGHAITEVSSRGMPTLRILAMAAAILVFAGLALFSAHHLGREQAIATAAPITSTPQLVESNPRTSLPWARYELRQTHHGYTAVPLTNSNPMLNP